MSGSKTNAMNRKEILATTRKARPEEDFVWDGSDEDDRPATSKELRAGVDAYRKQRGRPAGSGTKEQVSIRLDQSTLKAFRATGRGWPRCSSPGRRRGRFGAQKHGRVRARAEAQRAGLHIRKAKAAEPARAGPRP